MTDAEICRDRGWTAGTVLEGLDSNRTVCRIQITAIGEKKILARELICRNTPVDRDESLWTLAYRGWVEVKP